MTDLLSLVLVMKKEKVMLLGPVFAQVLQCPCLYSGIAQHSTA